MLHEGSPDCEQGDTYRSVIISAIPDRVARDREANTVVVGVPAEEHVLVAYLDRCLVLSQPRSPKDTRSYRRADRARDAGRQKLAPSALSAPREWGCVPAPSQYQPYQCY